MCSTLKLLELSFLVSLAKIFNSPLLKLRKDISVIFSFSNSPQMSFCQWKLSLLNSNTLMFNSLKDSVDLHLDQKSVWKLPNESHLGFYVMLLKHTQGPRTTYDYVK